MIKHKAKLYQLFSYDYLSYITNKSSYTALVHWLYLTDNPPSFRRIKLKVSHYFSFVLPARTDVYKWQFQAFSSCDTLKDETTVENMITDQANQN